MVLSNGNRVTVTIGETNNRTSYFKTVTVERPDGTGDSATEERNVGLFGTGLFNVRGPYNFSIPDWAKR